MGNIKRNYNLDLLRILSMIFVIVLHCVDHGNLLNNVPAFSANGIIIRIIYTFAFVAVNCFVLISGYFLCTSKFKLEKLVVILVQAVFYSVAIFVIISIPKLWGGRQYLAILKYAVKSVLLIGQYWFVKSYLLMYLFSPFLNSMIRNINKKGHFIFCCVILGTFSVLQNIIFFEDFSGINNGYSFLWFCALYIIAAYFRLYVPSVASKQKLMFAGYVLCVLIAAGEKIIANLITPYIFGKVIFDNLFYSYNSIVIAVASLFLFQFFRGITISCNYFQKVIKIVSPLMFAVYLIHDNSRFSAVLWNWIDFPSKADSPFLILYMIGIVFCIFAICCILEFVRKLIFEKLRISSFISKWCDNIQMRITRFFDLKIPS